RWDSVLTLWAQTAQALRDVDSGLSRRVLEWPVEAVVQAGLKHSEDFARHLGGAGQVTWVPGRNGLADSTRLLNEAPVAGVEVKITAKENEANYDCQRGCKMQLEHLAHQGPLVIITSSKRADRDGPKWPPTATGVTLTELADIMEHSSGPEDSILLRALFELPTNRLTQERSQSSLPYRTERAEKHPPWLDHDAALPLRVVQGVGRGLGQEVRRDLDLHVLRPVIEVAVQSHHDAQQAGAVVAIVVGEQRL